jgi:hypothetical protein
LAICSCSVDAPTISTPSIATITSPLRMPASEAAPPSTTDAT